MIFRRAWDGKEWQTYTLLLAQYRHGASNLQRVPDKVQGDAGVEFFSLDGCLYQCYAPEEVSDVAKATSAIKAKATRDLDKLIKYATILEKILQGTKGHRWILLCPFVDDKSAVAHVRKHGKIVRQANLSFIADGFEALVQSQEDFAKEIELIRQQSLGPHPTYSSATTTEVEEFDQGHLSETLTKKLERAFPKDDQKEIEGKKSGFVRSHLTRENALDEFRREHPMLWEKIVRCIESQEQALILLGGDGSAPIEHMKNALKDLKENLRADLPTIDMSVIGEIATGTLSDWLMRCPMDFPKDPKE